MKKRLLEKINRFCSYLTDWENKREYYIKEFLPQIVDYNFSGLNSEARILFLEIREETNAEEWKNIINIIIKVKEEYITIIKNNFEKPFIELQKKYKFEGFIHTTSFENFIRFIKIKNYILEIILKIIILILKILQIKMLLLNKKKNMIM